jgi:hypothetical protein
MFLAQHEQLGRSADIGGDRHERIVPRSFRRIAASTKADELLIRVDPAEGAGRTRSAETAARDTQFRLFRRVRADEPDDTGVDR